jgi:hypothetical protein
MAWTLLATATSAAACDRVTIRHTELEGRACIVRADDESSGAGTRECPGIYGYRLLVVEDDERISVSIVAPGERLFPLQFWDVVTRGFSTLTGKAEWHIRGVGRGAVPVALIVRLETLNQTVPEHPRRVPLLVVAKITSDTACVTHRVDATARGALDLARRLADSRKPVCLGNRPHSLDLTQDDRAPSSETTSIACQYGTPICAVTAPRK